MLTVGCAGLSAFQPYSHQATVGSGAHEQEADQATSAGMYNLAAAGVSMEPTYAYAGQAPLMSAAAEITPVCCCHQLVHNDPEGACARDHLAYLFWHRTHLQVAKVSYSLLAILLH